MEMTNKPTFNEVYNKHFNEVKNYIRHKISLQSKCAQFDAEELANDVFIKANNHFSSFDPEKSAIRTWLFVITNNTIIDWSRTKMKKQMYSYDNVCANSKNETDYSFSVPTIDSVDLHDKKLINDKINDAFESLKGINKEITKLFYIDNLKLNEISEQFNMPLNSVKTIVFRSRKVLTEKLESLSY